jgi:hypothetical protein
MNTETTAIDNKRFKEIILSDLERFDFFDDIYENYLIPSGYRYVHTIPSKTSDQLLDELGISLRNLDNEAYKWSSELRNGAEIPKEKYDIILKYWEYLLFISAERTASYWE